MHAVDTLPRGRLRLALEEHVVGLIGAGLLELRVKDREVRGRHEEVEELQVRLLRDALHADDHLSLGAGLMLMVHVGYLESLNGERGFMQRIRL